MYGVEKKFTLYQLLENTLLNQKYSLKKHNFQCFKSCKLLFLSIYLKKKKNHEVHKVPSSVME